MKLYDVLGTGDVVAGLNVTQARNWYMDNEFDDFEQIEKLRLTEITDEDLDRRRVYDEFGDVRGYATLVSFREMMEYENEDWDGIPFIFDDSST